jgi:hypothetical protein
MMSKNSGLSGKSAFFVLGIVVGIILFTGVSGNNGGGEGNIPVGGIIIWYGSVNEFNTMNSSVNEHWVICEGGTVNGLGVPDLRNRFVYGTANNAVIGNDGGSTSHYHSYSGTVGSAIDYLTGTHEEARRPDIISDSENIKAKYESSTEGHSHTYSGNTNSVSNLPPYRYQMYIMRVA